MIERLFHGVNSSDRRLFCRTVVIELNSMWDLGLKVDDHEIETYRSFIQDMSGRIRAAVEDDEYAHGKDETYEILGALASKGRDRIASLIDAVAQILFLEREQREEYVNNKEIAPPYVISKLLLEYAMKSRRLDQISDLLTKDYCATRCNRLPTGCCHVPGYDLDLVPEAMLNLQVLEAQRAGFHAPPQSDKCRYHSSSGCAIVLFKSPACIGYLCEPLHGFLKNRYPADELSEFVQNLSVFRNCILDRKEIFEAMDATIRAGMQLIEIDG